MKVIQSYHMREGTNNRYQADMLTFDITLEAEQLIGEVLLENKLGAEPWEIVHGDEEYGTLTYGVRGPTFDFTFDGKVSQAGHEYILIAGMNPNGEGFDPDTYLGKGTSDSSKGLNFVGSIELDEDMKDVKVWLVPTENWVGEVGGTLAWPSPWTASYDTFLWETGLMWYDDTDL